MNKKLFIPVFLAALVVPLFLQRNASPLEAEMFGEANSKSEYIAYASKIGAQLADEGFVLLKNDGFLPIANASGKKVSLVGKSSTSLLRGGSGSGAGGIDGSVKSYDLQSSLKEVGFTLNSTLESFYKNDDKSGIGRTNGNSGWKGISQVQIGETPMSCYTDDLKTSMDQYNDFIMQVITREGSEGCDVKTCDARDFIPASNMPDRTTNKSFTPASPFSNKHALELSDNEAALFEEAKKHTDHMIIVINSSNVFECDVFEKDPKVSAIIWIGNPGDVGPGALGRIITGAVNPSGRTVDTWARDFTKDPTFQNFSDNAQTNLTTDKNGNPIYAAQDTMFNADGTPVKSPGTYKGNNGVPKYEDEKNKVVEGGLNGVKPSSYISYEEGIYYDYRYYETRYADMAEANKSSADTWYAGEEGVVYPFGHGLSYTTFEQKIVSSNVSDKTLTDPKTRVEVTVNVKNTGKVAGKEVVQLYWKAPYFSGEIEKADHVLCAFAKTDLLEPGKSQDLVLDFYLQDVANYDFSDANGNGFSGYELDEGDYAILLGKNAHEIIDEIEFSVDAIKYPLDRYTGNKVENRFTDNGFYSSLPSENDFEFRQMSRANFAGTFPTHPTIVDRTLKQNSRVQEYYTHEFRLEDLEENDTFEYMPEAAYKTKEDIEALDWTQAKDTNGEVSIKFTDMLNTEIDDPRWKEFMDQLTFDEMIGFVSGGGSHNQELRRFSKPGTGDSDGPQRFKIMWWVSGPIVAATFNIELAKKQGECVGMEGKFANQETQGWAGPGVNIHRSPFGGRNFEYYSADPFLTGRISGRVVAGASDRGVYCYFKHFAVNDQEKNREGVSAFLTEQALREIYLKAFQLPIQEGKSLGLMSSYNRLGLMETAASYPLLTEVLRNEWGFKGAIISDMTHLGNPDVNNYCYENINNRVLAGCNQQLDGKSYIDYMEAEWDDDYGCPVFEDTSGNTVESYSWWYAVRKNAQEAIWQCARSSKNINSFVKPIEEIEFSNTKDGIFTSYCGQQIDIEIILPVEIDEGGEYNEKYVESAEISIDPFTPLPSGLSLQGNRIVGSSKAPCNKFVHVLVNLSLEGEVNPVVVGKSFELIILYEKVEEPEQPKEEKKKGCFGGFEVSMLSISLLSALFAGGLILKKKKEAE